MFRIEAICLPDTSAIGSITVGGPGTPLSAFDLIIITGSNGSGKTSLTEPLRGWSQHAQRRWCASTEPEPSDLDPKADIVPTLLARNSAELLGEFQSIEAALASAIGAQRRSAEAVLLEKLVPSANRGDHRLANLVQLTAPERSHDVSSALENYLAAERDAVLEIPALPLTLGTYNQLARNAAKDSGTQWTELPRIDANQMKAAESALNPGTESVPGYPELRIALATAERATDGTELKAQADNLREAEIQLGDALSAALKVLGDVGTGASTKALLEQCAARAAAERAKADSLADEAKALDALEKLRTDARELLESTDRSTCPVCDQAIAASDIVRRLAESGTSEAATILRNGEAAHRTQSSEFDGRAAALTRASDGRTSALRRLLGVTSSMQKALRTNVIMLGDHDTWFPWVNEFAKQARAAMDGLAKQIEAVEANPRPEAADQLVRETRSAQVTLRDILREADQCREASTKSVVAAQEAVEKLRRLRHLLVARETLNALEWRSNWNQVHAAKAQASRLQLWQSAVRSLIAERKAQAAPLYDALLTNSDIERRFAALLRAFRPHELLGNPALRPNGVVNGSVTITRDQRAPSKLSEGYRAAVNLAAFIAVAGHQGPGQRHKAGWILVDEPTNGLDPQNRDRLADHLGSLSMVDMPKQVFVTTFEPSFADRLADAAKRAGHRRILRITLRDWSTRPASAPDLIRVN